MKKIKIKKRDPLQILICKREALRGTKYPKKKYSRKEKFKKKLF
jgi:hypothetical protein